MKIEQIERIHELVAILDENIELEKKWVWNEERWTKSRETLQPNNRAFLGITEALEGIKILKRVRLFEKILTKKPQTLRRIDILI